MAELVGDARALGEVRRTEEDHIQPRQRADLLQLRQRFRILDLGDDEALLVGLADIVVFVDQAELAVGVAAVDGSAAHRMELGEVDDLLRLLQAHQMGHHDAGGIRLQRADEVVVAALGHAGQRVAVVDLRGAHRVFDGFPVVGHMLHVDPHTVKAAHSRDLGRDIVCDVDFCTGRKFPFAHFRDHFVFWIIHLFASGDNRLFVIRKNKIQNRRLFGRGFRYFPL